MTKLTQIFTLQQFINDEPNITISTKVYVKEMV